MNKKYDIVFFVDMGAFVAINKTLINIMLENKQEVYIPATELKRLSTLIQDESIDKSLRSRYKDRLNLATKLIKKGKFASFGNEDDQNVDLLITQFLLKCTKNNVLVIVNEKKRKDNFLLLKGSYEHEGHYIDVAKVDDLRISLYDKKDLVEKLVSEDIKMVVIENSRQKVNDNPGVINEPAEEEDILQQYRLEEPQEGEVLPESNDEPDHDKEYENLYVDPSIKNKIRNNEGNNDGKEIDFGNVLINGPVEEPEPGENIEEEKETIEEPIQKEKENEVVAIPKLEIEEEPEIKKEENEVSEPIQKEKENEVVANPMDEIVELPEIEKEENEVSEQNDSLSSNEQALPQEENSNETAENENVVEEENSNETTENENVTEEENVQETKEDEDLEKKYPFDKEDFETIEENNIEEAPQEEVSTENVEKQVEDNDQPDDTKEEDTSEETPIDDETPSDKEASEEVEQPIDEKEKEEEKDKKPFDEATANKFNF